LFQNELSQTKPRIAAGTSFPPMSTAITGSVPSSATAASAVSSDVRVTTLKAQIQDWSTCPTTAPQVKQEKVTALQAKLDVVEQSIKTDLARKGSTSPGSLDIFA